jgi:hypothetical protein
MNKLVFAIPALLLVPLAIQAANAWQLTVNLSGAELGHGGITVDLTGQNGFRDAKNVPNGPFFSTCLCLSCNLIFSLIGRIQ